VSLSVSAPTAVFVVVVVVVVVVVAGGRPFFCLGARATERDTQTRVFFCI